MILNLISQTVLIIVLLSFSFGPAFFALINTGIKYGYRTGSLLAFGVVASDLVLCTLMILVNEGATDYIENDKNRRFMGIVAGIILIIFGALYLRKPVKATDEAVEVQGPSAAFMIFKGFFLNSLNPSIWLLWLANVASVKRFEFSVQQTFLYFGIVLAVVLSFELGKVWAANRLKMILTPKIMHNINIITGVFLIIFGIGLIYNYYYLHD